MHDSRRRIEVAGAPAAQREQVLSRQWLVTNGLGGFASGTLAGRANWRYHGLLVAALPAPLGRVTMLNHLDEVLRLADGTAVRIGGNGAEDGGRSFPLHRFETCNQMPHWRYEHEGHILTKRLVMPNLQNTVHLTYELDRPLPGARLELRPALQFRPFETPANAAPVAGYAVRCLGRRIEVEAPDGYPPLRLYIDDPESIFVAEAGSQREVLYALDAERGFDGRGQLWSPGYFSIPLADRPVTLLASTEDWHTLLALTPQESFQTENVRVRRLLRTVARATHEPAARDLTVAADQFIIAPRGRVKDAARARAEGNELRSVIAGYHWFTDWGRDTMISLEGLALTTGRHQEAAWILHTFARAVQDGLIPNLFPEGENKGLYHTADASLWFFHAVHRYLTVTREHDILVALLPVLRDIIAHHIKGTRFGIGMDPADGLLRQGEEGYQLTWMDAKVGDWVVTPRRGKAVEINALWYNALRVLEGLLRAAGDTAAATEMGATADRAQASFNARFWNAEAGCLFDVIDGPHGSDPAIRPNQVFAISLPHSVLAPARWEAVMGVVERELLTPVGLRTLSPRHPDYKSRYSGDLRARDAAYHQGTVWPWLIGPFVDAWVKLHPGKVHEARRFLDGLVEHLDDRDIGSISEIFDAEAPYHPRGCIAQAWSVAEILRTLVNTAPAAPDAAPTEAVAPPGGSGENPPPPSRP